jgi:acid phosphatase type 7
MKLSSKFFQTILFIVLFALVVFGQSTPDTFLVKPYLQFGQKTSMHVLWETHGPSTATVEYTEAILHKAKTVSFEKTIEIKDLKNLHEIKLDNLKPSTKYLYRITSHIGNKKIISGIKTFKTNIEDDEPYFFSFIADTQRNNGTPWAWGRIAELIWKERPHFVVMGGDLVDKGSVKTDWTHHFFPHGNVMMSRYPMYTILGNHEQDAQNYYDYMVNPEPEYYYTFTYGNAQFFMIDTNRDVAEGSEQYTWLDWELSKSKATWKFVVHHHPPYSSDSDDHGDTFIGASNGGSLHARNLTPLFDKYNVDFDLFGHTHLYERTWPIFENKIDKVNGTVYINAGGAGGYLEDFDPVRNWFSLDQEVTHHYTTFAIHGDELIFKAINDKGELFDSFTLTKNRNKKTSTYSKPPAPKMQYDKAVFQDEAIVKLDKLSDEFSIRYTLDGSEPTSQSMTYANPLIIKENTEFKAACFSSNGVSSGVIKQKFTKMAPMKGLNKNVSKNQGLSYKYYEGEWSKLPDFSKLKPVKEGKVNHVNTDGIQPREQGFGLSLEGYIEVPETDTYTFYLYTDDGSKLYLNDQMLIDSDGNHGARYDYGTVILEKGKHKLKIDYHQQTGGYHLSAGMKVNGKDKRPFNPWQLSH